MSMDLHISLLNGEALALAVLLDGRESVDVPTWRESEDGPLNRFKAITDGPVMIQNTVDAPMILTIGQDEDWQTVVGWLGGNYLPNVQTLTIPGHSIETLLPSKTFIGLRVADANGVLMPVGLLKRGPSSMKTLQPMIYIAG